MDGEYQSACELRLHCGFSLSRLVPQKSNHPGRSLCHLVERGLNQ